MPDQPPPYQDLRWLVTTALALWGAGLSTYQQLVQRRPKVRVLLQQAIVPARSVYELGEERETEDALSIRIKNYGYIDVTFEAYCCELEIKGVSETIVLNPRHVDPALPATIKHGQNIKMVVRAGEVAETLIKTSIAPPYKVRLVAKDAIGRRFYSRWLKSMFEVSR